MRTLVSVYTLCVVVLGLSGIAAAHVGPTFYARQVDPKTITIDGKGDDPGWNAPLWDNQNNTITKEMLAGNVLGGEMPADEDWSGILKVGWSAPPDNRLYIYSKVTDDIMNDNAVRNGDAHWDDSMAVLVDANHDGGDYNAAKPRGTIAQEFAVRASAEDLPPGPAQDEGHTRWWIYAPPERMWLTDPQWMEWTVEKPVGRTNVTYAYEGKMILWDRAGDTPETSIGHVNAEGQTIGLTFQWNDADAKTDVREAQPGTQGPEGANAWYDAGQFGDFVLISGLFPDDDLPEPTMVKPTSWGAIKATFRW